MTTPATRNVQERTTEGTLFVAFELSDWTLAFSTVLRWLTQKTLHDGQRIAQFSSLLASGLQQGACMFIAVLTHHISQRI